jgi:hypothetical protein
VNKRQEQATGNISERIGRIANEPQKHSSEADPVIVYLQNIFTLKIAQSV